MSVDMPRIALRVDDRVHIRLAECADLASLWPQHVTQMDALVQNRVWDEVHTGAQWYINLVVDVLVVELSPEAWYAIADRDSE